MLQVSSQSLLNPEASTQSVDHYSIGSTFLSGDIFFSWAVCVCMCVKEKEGEKGVRKRLSQHI